MTDKRNYKMTKQVETILKDNHIPIKWFDDIIIATEQGKILVIAVLKKGRKPNKANVERAKERCAKELDAKLHVMLFN